jgi:hypothetical protein
MKEKAVCGDLFQLAEFARLATPLARFGKADRAATNQKVGSSNPPGRTTSINKNAGFCDATGEGYAFRTTLGSPLDHLLKKIPKKTGRVHTWNKELAPGQRWLREFYSPSQKRRGESVKPAPLSLRLGMLTTTPTLVIVKRGRSR